jgi:transcriptional regulator with XRE-family HTH domain
VDDTGSDWRVQLQEARWRVGLTQEELAGMSGLSSRTISDIERGRAIPRASTIRLVAQTLGLSRPETEKLLYAVRAAAAERLRAAAGPAAT